MRDRFAGAMTLEQFIGTAESNRELWHTLHERARVEPDAVEAARGLPARRHLLALVEDWCGDGVNTVPVLARLAEAVPERLELRVLERDANPELMDAHLSPSGGRSIPVVIVLDEEYREIGWWGARPAELQAWFEATGHSLAKDERYRLMRTWYARDRGRSALAEVLALAGTALPVTGDRPRRPASDPGDVEPVAAGAR